MTMSVGESKDFNIQDYLGIKFNCSCGKEHTASGIKKVIIQKGAVDLLPELLDSLGFNRVFMAADTNTYKVAGWKAEELITGKNAAGFRKHVFEREHDLIPDEAAIGEFLVHIGSGTDVILAVGSGVINDLCKFMSYKLGIPYIILATAPSMDGFASDGSALILDNLKTTLSTTVPAAIIGDTDILKEAPLDMIASGFADMAGKFSALNDWRLGNLINGEYYCELVADMVMKSLRKCIDSSEKLMMRDENAIKSLMEGLVLTGIAMSFTGNSRPASGAEHHLSHFMEMMCMFEGKEVPLHGLKVGINTVIITKLRRLLSDMAPDFEAAAVSAAAFDKARWTGDVKRLFRQAAPGIISLNEKEKINSAEERISRLKKIKESWDKISNILKDTPSAEEIGSLLTAAGAPVRAEELGFGKELVIDGLIYCKEIRARYTVLQLAWDLGLLEKLAREIV